MLQKIEYSNILWYSNVFLRISIIWIWFCPLTNIFGYSFHKHFIPWYVQILRDHIHIFIHLNIQLKWRNYIFLCSVLDQLSLCMKLLQKGDFLDCDFSLLWIKHDMMSSTTYMYKPYNHIIPKSWPPSQCSMWPYQYGSRWHQWVSNTKASLHPPRCRLCRSLRCI